MCLEAEEDLPGKIGCTQPRRIAAITIAHRIAEELGEEVGRSVGYKIRFRESGRQAFIKIMTDGMLLAETQGDPGLLEYDTLIIDEAHERTLNIDFILGILRTLLPHRPELKVIITSATLDTEKFSAAFGHAPMVKVEGRTYPVDVEYMPIDRDLEEAGELTYVDMAVKAIDGLREGKKGTGTSSSSCPPSRTSSRPVNGSKVAGIRGLRSSPSSPGSRPLSRDGCTR